MRNVSDKVLWKIKTHSLRSITFFFFLKVVPFMRKCEKYGTPRQAADGNMKWNMRIACWLIKATDTHSEFVIIIAFPRQQRLRERASILRSYIHFLSWYVKIKLIIGWRERNQQDATNLMFIIKLLYQHVSGIIMPIIRRTRVCTAAYGVLHCNKRGTKP